ncbi:hypothetical protein C7974DRAFT_319122 [Boeremia exigua]|uniref:uncharacterized protein n=1 Tax=Boeremia exigua TaxID=749465 RepID=UPI001E8CB3A7|nr:uncharacterized protein C7974DRAFT_319122 [Boeremia exigua]KAH6616875.1 hypothetical protein C7974DRAFT_319122 [Boeremia exigua]
MGVLNDNLKQCASTTDTSTVRADGCGSCLERRSSIRPKSNPDLRNTSMTSSGLSSRPRKTCLKQKTKSANATPPLGTSESSEKLLEDLTLRRRKTVDFAEVSLELSNGDQDERKKDPIQHPRQISSCPGTAMLTRCSLASPAMTRTDVHVIAVPPSSSKPGGVSRTQPGELEKSDPATPTIQIVESKNGSYEVVWDDVPPEHNVDTQKRRSSAGEALEALSTGPKGLERVNTKLTEWSGTWNTPSDCFKPTIVVFPDDDGCRPHFECTIVDDEDIDIFAPPNSARMSAVPSRHVSRPASAHASPKPSQDESSVAYFTQEIPLGDPSPHVVMNQEIWPDHLMTARRTLGVPCPERKLSDSEEADVKFRNHRDSVTLAHSRLIHSGGVRPELFAHRDSVTIAKKRMHAKNRAASASRLRRQETKSEPGLLYDGDVAVVPLLPVVKAHAIDALKNSTPTSILRRPDLARHPHIRIGD